MYTLASEKKLAVIASLLEGNSVRSTERMTGVHRDTICRLLVQIGEHCAASAGLSHAQHRRCKIRTGRRNMDLRRQERQRTSALTTRPKLATNGYSSQWTRKRNWCPSFVVGKRTEETTWYFVQDLAEAACDARFQLTTDGFHFYQRGRRGRIRRARSTSRNSSSCMGTTASTTKGEVLPRANRGDDIQDSQRRP